MTAFTDCPACALCFEQLIKGLYCVQPGYQLDTTVLVLTMFFFSLLALNVFGDNICIELICDVTCFPVVTATLSCYNDKATLERLSS